MGRPSIDTARHCQVDKKGNVYTPIVTDNYTRWIEFSPVRTARPQKLRKPSSNISDDTEFPIGFELVKGPNFVNATLEELKRILNFEHEIKNDIPMNFIVEHSSDEVMRHLRAMIFAKRVQETWRFA